MVLLFSLGCSQSFTSEAVDGFGIARSAVHLPDAELVMITNVADLCEKEAVWYETIYAASGADNCADAEPFYRDYLEASDALMHEGATYVQLFPLDGGFEAGSVSVPRDAMVYVDQYTTSPFADALANYDNDPESTDCGMDIVAMQTISEDVERWSAEDGTIAIDSVDADSVVGHAEGYLRDDDNDHDDGDFRAEFRTTACDDQYLQPRW